MISLSASSVGRIETREGKVEGKMRRRKENEKTRKKCAWESLIRSSGGLSPSSCTLLEEYRLSVVRLGVLHSSKYLGIFEESRVPKKTVYSVRRDPSQESERAGPGTVIARHRACRKKIYKGKIYGANFITKHYRAYVRVSSHRTHWIQLLIISILIPVIHTKCMTNRSLHHVA